jgi:molybdopterin-guanine dinucleotide biosynthesis protein A
MPAMADVTGIVFAGGLGTRLGGVKKALLEVGGRPIIERILDAIAPLSREVIVVDNDDSLALVSGTRIVPDSETRAGVLTALHSGLSAADGELCVVVACDMPFLNPELLGWLVDLAEDCDVVIPLTAGQMEPMHAVYRRKPCLEAIGEALARGDKRMISYLGAVRVREVSETELRARDPELRSFFNINTSEDLELARKMAG